jgi:hypothetical protein
MAFDSVLPSRNAGRVREYLIKAVMSLYRGSTVVTKYGMNDKIPVDRGVLQGDTLSPYIFIMVMDRVLSLGRPCLRPITFEGAYCYDRY